jgi:hypothetical protein
MQSLKREKHTEEHTMDTQSRLPMMAINHVYVVGKLDRQIVGGKSITRRLLRNDVQGYVEQIQLQLPTPYGRNFALAIELDQAAQDFELLHALQIGETIAIAGRLAWQQRIDSRFPVLAQRVRTANDLVLQPISIGRVDPTTQSGSVVQLCGTVLDAPRMLRHPTQGAVLLASTVVRLEEFQPAMGTHARMATAERVPIVVPANHPHAGNLLRPGNQVAIEGMLERVTIPIRGDDVDLAISMRDTEWHDQQRHLDPAHYNAELQRYQRERRRLGEITRMRVVAGYIELVAGAPASIREAQTLRRKRVRNRTGGQHPAASAH